MAKKLSLAITAHTKVAMGLLVGVFASTCNSAQKLEERPTMGYGVIEKGEVF